MKLAAFLLLCFSSIAFSSEQIDCSDNSEQCQALAIEQTNKVISKYTLLETEYQTYLTDVGDADCGNATTTIDMNVCKHVEVKQAEIIMTRYLMASLKQLQTYSNMAQFIDEAQQAWRIYQEKECNAVYQQWAEGSIRGVMAGECQLRLTQERTHVLWRSYLTYMDSTAPVLPEPKF